MLRLIAILTLTFGFGFANANSSCFLSDSPTEISAFDLNFMDSNPDIPEAHLDLILQEAASFYSITYDQASLDYKNGILTITEAVYDNQRAYDVAHATHAGTICLLVDNF